MRKMLAAAALGVCSAALAVTGTACLNKPADGKDGKDGRSAYEIWLDNGHEGTENDFLLWLKGADGVDGKDGKDGIDGKDGKDGIDGSAGASGAEGSAGANGKSAFEIFLEYNPDYTGSEEDWVKEYLASKSEAVGITSIEKTSSDGLKDYYTITLSDGTTSVFCVTNGKDGKNGEDGKSPTVEDLYESFKKEYGDALSFEEFCRLVFSLDKTDGVDGVGSALCSSVKLYTSFTKTVISYGKPVTTDALYTGSAVIYKMEEEYTYLLTNYHVVYVEGTNEGICENICAYLYGSEEKMDKNNPEPGESAVSCEYVGGAAECDLALLRARTQDITGVNPNARAVKVNKSYRVGEEVFAIGNTDNGGIEVTRGIVSVDRERVALNVDGTVRGYYDLRMDAMIYEGNSGGGLFNARGELVGICQAGDAELCFINNAIPAVTACAAADGFLHYAGNTKKLRLGVTFEGKNTRYEYDEKTGGRIVEDLLVYYVLEGGLFDRLGIAEGDIVTAICVNGQKIELYRMFDTGDAVLTVREGDGVSFEYLRADEIESTQTYTVEGSDLVNVE